MKKLIGGTPFYCRKCGHVSKSPCPKCGKQLDGDWKRMVSVIFTGTKANADRLAAHLTEITAKVLPEYQHSKWKVRMAVVVIALLSMAAPTGCRLNTPDDTPPQTTSVTNSVRRWSQGISMTFPAAPTEGTAALLKLAKIKEKSQRVYVIEVYDRHDQLQNTALENALREGAVLAGTMP